MPKTEPVETEIIVDDRKARAKFDEYERRIRKVEASGKRAGSGMGGTFAAAAVGGAAGFVAGAIMNNAATNAISDLLLNIVAASLLPLLQQLPDILKTVGDILVPLAAAVAGIIGFMKDEGILDEATMIGIGAAVGGKLGGPLGAVAGGSVVAGAVVSEQAVAAGRERNAQSGREAEVNLGIGFLDDFQRYLFGGRDAQGNFQPGVLQLDRASIWGPDIVG